MRLFLVAFFAMTLSSSAAPPLIVAHRGDSSKAPENTLASIRSGIEAKADLIEFDVRLTTDGELVLFHDKDLKRFTGKKTPFDSLTFAEARELDVGSWFDEKNTFAAERPPTLKEAIEACLDGGATPLIERKSGPAAGYVKIIHELDAADRVIVQAFDWKFLADLRKLAPEIRMGALGDKKVDAVRVAELEQLAPQWVGWNQKYLTEANIARFQELRFKIAVWTVNDLARLRLFTNWGVNALITDRPGEARDSVSGEN